jgi:hypothetical protein
VSETESDSSPERSKRLKSHSPQISSRRRQLHVCREEPVKEVEQICMFEINRRVHEFFPVDQIGMNSGSNQSRNSSAVHNCPCTLSVMDITVGMG